jgi:hypothetical protein
MEDITVQSWIIHQENGRTKIIRGSKPGRTNTLKGITEYESTRLIALMKYLDEANKQIPDEYTRFNRIKNILCIHEDFVVNMYYKYKTSGLKVTFTLKKISYIYLNCHQELEHYHKRQRLQKEQAKRELQKARSKPRIIYINQENNSNIVRQTNSSNQIRESSIEEIVITSIDGIIQGVLDVVSEFFEFF